MVTQPVVVVWFKLGPDHEYSAPLIGLLTHKVNELPLHKGLTAIGVGTAGGLGSFNSLLNLIHCYSSAKWRASGKNGNLMFISSL